MSGKSDKAPEVVKLANGSAAWSWGNNPPTPFSMDVMAGRKYEDYKITEGIKWEEVPRGTYDPDARLKAMDADGVDTSVLHPNFARVFIKAWLSTGEIDPELRYACMRAYNDHISEFCSVNPKRLTGLGMVPIQEVPDAVAELKRIAKMAGIHGVLLPSFCPDGRPYSHSDFEPFWNAAEELNLAISLHGGGKPGSMFGSLEDPGTSESFITLSPMEFGAQALTVLVWSGLFDRHPKLRMVMSEAGIGWLAYLKERAVNVYNRHRFWAHSVIKNEPGYYFGRNVFASFVQDVAGIATRDLAGIGAILWGSDYPHTDTTWPRSQEFLEAHFKGVSAADRQQILYENPTRVYGL